MTRPEDVTLVLSVLTLYMAPVWAILMLLYNGQKELRDHVGNHKAELAVIQKRLGTDEVNNRGDL